MQRYEQASEFQEKMVAVNRVTKVVKGGRNFRFAALMVVGDGAGRIGTGIGKATEIPEAIRKGVDDAKKHLITVPLQGTTLPHETVGLFGTTKIEGAEGTTGSLPYSELTYVQAPGTTWAPASLFQMLGYTVTLDGTTLNIQ